MSTMSIAVIAGERSGDEIGALVLRHLSSGLGGDTIFVVGGKEMQSVPDAVTLLDSAELSVAGLTEVARHYFRIRRHFNRLVERLVRERIDLLVTIDFPGFNLRLARALSKRGVRTLHLVSPQVWAWRSWRLRSIRRSFDDLIVFFPFEVDWYARRGMSVEYFGHPGVDAMVESSVEIRERAADLFREETRAIICWLPGSRNSEVQRHLPLMVDAAARLGDDDYLHVLSTVSSVEQALYDRARDAGLQMWNGSTATLLEASTVGVIKSGSSTLHAMVYGLPMVIIYKVSRMTYRVASRLASITMIGMPNILAGRPVVPELVQDEATVESLVAEVRRISDERTNSEIQSVFAEQTDRLATGDASRRIADFILQRYQKVVRS